MKNAVARASASAAESATTEALAMPSAGQPRRGSRMWPSFLPLCSRCWNVAADVASARSRRRTTPSRRHAPWTPEKTPGLDKRARRDVECSLCLAAKAFGKHQQLEELFLHRYGIQVGETIEPAHFAGIAIDGQLLLQAVDLIKSDLRH